MPKLSPENAAAAENAQTGSFQLLPVGTYTLRLTEVEPTTSKTQKPMWVWKFEVDEGPYKGTSMWDRTVIQDNTMWKIAQVFRSFGVSADTHTDDLIGKTVQAVIDQKVIGAGKRKGETGNEVAEYIDAATATSETDDKSAQGGSTEDVPF